jgi:PKHD-type hydroxylase
MPVRLSRPLISRYAAGHSYGKHYDRPIMQTPGPLRTDFSATVFLSSDYQGGELVIYADGADMRIKGKAGDIVLYPSGQLHEVLPVTGGERLVLVLWIQSLFRDEQIRQTVAELGEVHKKLRETDPAETLKLLRAINTLTRKFGEP